MADLRHIAKDLAKAQGRDGKPAGKVHAIVIGTKMRERDKQGHVIPDGRLVSMETDCPPIVTWCTDAGYVAPTKPQIAAILKFWRREPLAPDTYSWTAGEDPPLTIQQTADEYRPSHPTEEA
jgi:hypothetical protein